VSKHGATRITLSGTAVEARIANPEDRFRWAKAVETRIDSTRGASAGVGGAG
jgi:hypothetical protein